MIGLDAWSCSNALFLRLFLKWRDWALFYFMSLSYLVAVDVEPNFLIGVKLILSGNLTTVFSNYMWVQSCEKLFLISLKVFEGEKYEVTIDAYFFHAENCTDDVVYMNKSEDLDYLHLFQCEETMEVGKYML